MIIKKFKMFEQEQEDFPYSDESIIGKLIPKIDTMLSGPLPYGERKSLIEEIKDLSLDLSSEEKNTIENYIRGILKSKKRDFNPFAGIFEYNPE